MNLEADIALGVIGSGISRIDGLYTKLAQKQGVSYGIVQVLYFLLANDCATQKQMVELNKTPKQTINSVIKQLEKDGYITLETGDGDKREKQIRLTPRGKAYQREILQPFFELNTAVVNRIGFDYIRKLSNGLIELGNTMELELDLKEVSSKWEENAKMQEVL